MPLTRVPFDMHKGKGFLLAEVPDLAPVNDQAIWLMGRTSIGDGGEGLFVFDNSDLSTEVTLDTLQGVYIAPSTDLTGASGAWVRSFNTPYNPLWFGSNTVPGTTDMGPAIQAAIDVALDGSHIEFPDRNVYAIGSGGVDIDTRNDLTISGNALLRPIAISSLAVTNHGTCAIRITDCTRVKIQDLVFDGNALAQGLVVFLTCVDSVITRCNLYGNDTRNAIYSLGCTNTEISFNKVHHSVNTGRGIYVGHYAAGQYDYNPKILFNHVHDNDATGIVTVSQGAIIIGNHSYNNAGTGINMSGYDNYCVLDALIQGNYSYNNLFFGIQDDVINPATVANRPKHITIVGNTLHHNDGYGIYLVASEFVDIIGNSCENNNEDGVGNGGGINVGEYSNNINIIGNSCCDDRAVPLATYGIYIASQTGDVSAINVIGNTCKGNKSYNIWVASVSGQIIEDVHVIDNICKDGGGYGINITESVAGAVVRCTVKNNTCENNTTSDLRLSAMDILAKDNIFITNYGNTASYLSFTDLDTTPNVYNREKWRANNSGATSITNFDGGIEGQELRVFFSNGNTTLVQGTLLLKGGVNVTPANNNIIRFEYISGSWRETFRNF